EFVDAHLALVAPIRRLSAEILQQIFHHCIVDDAEDFAMPAILSSDLPLHLGHICSEWRRICLATPELWSRFQLDLSHATDIESPRWLVAYELMRTWVTRSGQRPLDMCLSCTGHAGALLEDQQQGDEMVPSFLGYLATVSHRWRSLEL
ncbi:hypothetical protein C8J56DRAFT_741999, partial [Mycena floridula]